MKYVNTLLDDVRKDMAEQMARAREDVASRMVEASAPIGEDSLFDWMHNGEESTESLSTMDFTSMYPVELTFANTGGQYETERIKRFYERIF